MSTSADDAGPSSRPDNATFSDPCHSRKLRITDLPADVVANVFRYCCYEDVAVQLRPVCRRFCDIATMLLNSGFSTLGPKIDRAMVAVELNMSHARNDPDLKAMIQAFNALEIMKSQVNVCHYVAPKNKLFLSENGSTFICIPLAMQHEHRLMGTLQELKKVL